MSLRQSRERWSDIANWQNTTCRPESNRFARHAEDNGGGFILDNRRGTGAFHGQEAGRAIASHSRE
jgi:hypothetical protein